MGGRLTRVVGGVDGEVEEVTHAEGAREPAGVQKGRHSLGAFGLLQGVCLKSNQSLSILNY